VLRGDEWVVLGGMVLRRPRLRTQVPEARGVARLYRRSLPEPRAGEAVPLRADTLQIDVDRQCCSILWRGRVELAGNEALGSVHVVTGLQQPGTQVPCAAPFTLAPTLIDPLLDLFGGATVGLPNDLSKRLAAMPATPFQPAPGSERKPWMMNTPS